MLTRREFIAQSAGVVGATSLASARTSDPQIDPPRKLRYLGWQVGLSYQSMRPEGLNREYMLRLLDEMAENRMNVLSLMMQSYGYFDPDHDGYAWPAQHPKLLSYRDQKVINAQPDQEFLHEIIDEAASRKIEIHLFMNWGIWNPEFVKAKYPDSSLQMQEGKEAKGWLHCPDGPDAWQLGIDEVTDLLNFYKHPNVTGYAFERVSYAGGGACFCPHTRKAFEQATGKALEEAKISEREAWKTDQISRHLSRFTAQLRKLRPEISVGLHSQCARGWGHDPDRLADCGIDYLLPHTIQFPTTQRKLYGLLKHLAPNPCILHFCCRDRRPANYKLWIKTPEIIEEALGWVHDYPGDNIAGLLFFNEPATSPTNKNAVYQGLKRFTL